MSKDVVSLANCKEWNLGEKCSVPLSNLREHTNKYLQSSLINTYYVVLFDL